MSEDHAYYQLKELIRDEMLEQSPDLAKIMAKYKALTAAKDAEIAALKADNERLKDIIENIDSLCDDAEGPNMDAFSALSEIQEITHAVLFALSPADGDGVEETEEQCRERLNTEARQMVVDAATEDGTDYIETDEDREWLASYNQQVAWKYENYNPETTEYREKSKTKGSAECWHCDAPLVGEFDMCCKSYSTECGCYGLPVEPPFCSKECHVAFIEKWKGNDAACK